MVSERQFRIGEHYLENLQVLRRRRMLSELHLAVRFVGMWDSTRRLLLPRSLLLRRAADAELHRRLTLPATVVNVQQRHVSEHRRNVHGWLLLLHAIRMQRICGQRTVLQNGRCYVNVLPLLTETWVGNFWDPSRYPSYRHHTVIIIIIIIIMFIKQSWQNAVMIT